MKRIQTILIAGLLLLGSGIQAGPSTWLSSLQNSSIATALLEKIKANRVVVGSAIGLGAVLGAAYGVYATFFKDEFATYRKTAVPGGIQRAIIEAIDADLENVGKAHVARLSGLFSDSQVGMDAALDYNLAFSNKDTAAMKKMAIGLLKAAQKTNVA